MGAARRARLAADLSAVVRDVASGGPRARRAVDLAAGVLRGRWILRDARLDGRVYVGGGLRVSAEGTIAIGDGVLLFGGMIGSELVCHRGASLSIGAGSELNYGVSIEAWREVRIGERCRIASMVRISDHGRAGVEPVVLGDDVWLAHGAILEPGVTIGKGSIVSAGSVVTTSIPAESLAVGNPARAVRLEVLGRGPAARKQDGPAC